MTNPNSCPEPERLKRLLDGELSADEQCVLLAHLDICRACQETVESLAAGESSWADVADCLAREPAEVDPDIVRVKEAVQDARRTATLATGNHQIQISLDFLGPSTRAGSLGRLDHYEITELIGRGGNGLVLKAFDEELHRVVAIKVMAPQLATSGTARKRFKREGLATAAVSHDHVVGIHAVDECNGLPYLVMQYVAGQSLQEKLDDCGALELKEILRIAMQTAAGLAAAHAQGLVHRDIKPANILLENGIERVKITDFGLARAVDDASLTQTGVVAGTPQYMAPEQASPGAAGMDHRADLFSLGSVMYAMCTGHPPFRATTTMAVLKRVCEDTPRPIREINPEIPSWLCDLVTRLHAKKPEERFQSAKEVAELLEQCLAHVQQPAATRLPALVSRQGPTESKGGWIIRLALGLMAVGGIFQLIVLIHSMTRGKGYMLAIGSVGVGFALLAGFFLYHFIRQRKHQLQSVRIKRVFEICASVFVILGGIAAFEYMGYFNLTKRVRAYFFPPLTSYLRLEGVEPGDDFEFTGPEPFFSRFVAEEQRLLISLDNTGWKVVHGEQSPHAPRARDYTLEGRSGSYRLRVQRGGSIGFYSVTLVPGETYTHRFAQERHETATSDTAFLPLFNGKDLTGWKRHEDEDGAGEWRVREGVLVGSGARSHLFSEQGHYQNFHFRAEVKVNRNGAAGVCFRSEFGIRPTERPYGYEAEIRCTQVASAPKTGSLYRLQPVTEDLIKADEWFMLEIIAVEKRITIKVNGQLTVHFIDAREPYHHERGHFALQVWQPDTVVQFRKIEIKELPINAAE